MLANLSDRLTCSKVFPVEMIGQPFGRGGFEKRELVRVVGVRETEAS
jgi:hypothetical protein